MAQDTMGNRKLRYTMAVICIGLVMTWLLQNPFFPAAVRLMCFAILLLGLIRWSAAILLILIQLDLYIRTPALGTTQEPPGLMIAFLTVVLLMLLSRLRSSQELTGIRSATQLLTSAGSVLLNPGKRPFPIHAEEQGGVAAVEILAMALRSLLFVLGAGSLLLLFPEERGSVQQFGLTPSGLRTLEIGLVVFTCYILLTLPLSELKWKQLTPDQAGIYLRSRFAGWLHRDLRAVERKRRRLQRKHDGKLRRSGHNTSPEHSQKAD